MTTSMTFSNHLFLQSETDNAPICGLCGEMQNNHIHHTPESKEDWRNEFEKIWRQGCFSYKGDEANDPLEDCFIDMRGEEVKSSFENIIAFISQERAAAVKEERERMAKIIKSNMQAGGSPKSRLIRNDTLSTLRDQLLKEI